MKAVIKQSTDNQWFYILKAANGKTLLQSETMHKKSSCTRVIKKYFPAFKIVEEK